MRPPTSCCALALALLAAGPAGAQIAPFMSDIVYGTSHGNLVLDWYEPVLNAAPGPRPAVIYLHGGQAATGDKTDVANAELGHLRLMLDNGMVVFAINFRPFPEYVYPAQYIDAGQAIQHVRANAATYDVDPDRIIMWGNSGGSMIAGWLTYGEDLADPLGTPEEQISTRPLAWLNFTATTNFTLMIPGYPALFFEQPTLGEVDPQLLVDTSISLQIDDVRRAVTPPVCSFYGLNQNPPPLTNPHDATFMVDLHAHLAASFPAVAAVSPQLQLGAPGTVPGQNQKTVARWCMARFGLDHQLSLGHALAGTGGALPSLVGSGDFTAGGAFALDMQAAVQAPAVLFLVASPTQLDAPFKGGKLVPAPDVVIALPTLPDGSVSLAATMPAAYAGAVVLLQFWHADPAGPVGFAASNALEMVVE